MTVQAALKAAMRDLIGPSARAAGFTGSAPTWRRTNGAGDWALANVQLSSWGDRSATVCYLNLSVAPAPWLELEARTRPLPKLPTDTWGLFRRRLGDQWDVPSEQDAARVVGEMAAALESDGWPVLTGLLDRDTFLDRVREGDLGELQRAWGYEAFFTRAEALVLSDLGPSARLDTLLVELTALISSNGPQSWAADVEWIRARAEGIGG